MLDFLLVLGQIPGTDIQITFTELLILFFMASAIYEYHLHQRAIDRWRKWTWHRICVNYRRRKRIARTFIKTKRYRLGVFERRVIRNTKTYFRRRRRAVIYYFLRKKRLIRRMMRRSYLFAIDQTYGRCSRFVNSVRRAVSRRKRLTGLAIHRRVSSVKRIYYIKLVQARRLERRFKNSRAGRTFISLKNSVNQSA